MDFKKFDDYNPFESTALIRISEIGDASKPLDIHRVFMYNYCCYIYYQFELFEKNDTRKFKPSNIYQSLDNLDMLYDYRIAFKMIDFIQFEIKTFSGLQEKSVLKYTEHLRNYESIYQQLDLVCMFYYEEYPNNYDYYLQEHHHNFQYFEIKKVAKKLNEIPQLIYSTLYEAYFTNLDTHQFNFNNFEALILELKFYFNSRLILKDFKLSIQKLSLNWIGAIFDKIVLDMQWGEWPAFLTKLYEEFHICFPLITPKKDPDYPTSIFNCYPAFLLFDTIAQSFQTKVFISYAYRLLFDKGMITVGDTEFRNWFNQQKYPVQLLSYTETLANSTSSEREQFVKLIAKLLKVEI